MLYVSEAQAVNQIFSKLTTKLSFSLGRELHKPESTGLLKKRTGVLCDLLGCVHYLGGNQSGGNDLPLAVLPSPYLSPAGIVSVLRK